MADTRKDCCRQPANLEEMQTGQADLKMFKCSVCGCRHFEANAEPLPTK